jgi:hypothetical protein
MEVASQDALMSAPAGSCVSGFPIWAVCEFAVDALQYDERFKLGQVAGDDARR